MGKYLKDFGRISILVWISCVSPQAETASQIETKKSDRAPQLYESLGDSNRIKQLIELGKKELRPTYSQNADRQKAILYFLEAEKISQTASNQKWLEESRCLIGITHILGNNWKLGQPYFKQVIAARQQEGDVIGEINVLLRMSTTTFCDDCSENMTALNRALTLARKIGNKALEMLILMEMGYEHFQLNGGDTREAEQKAHEVLTIQEEIGVFPLTQAYHTLAENSVYKNPGEYGYLSNAYYFMSDVSQARGDLNQKLFYVLKAVKEIEASRQLTELEYAYFKLGNAYYELGQYDKSTEYHQKSLALSRKRGVLFIQVGIVSRIAAAMLKKNKAHEALQFLKNITSKGLSYTYEDKLLIDQCFGACYSALKQDGLAEKYYKKSVGWSQQTTSWFQYIALRGISQFYVKSGEFEKADPYLRQLSAAPPKKIIPSHQIEIHLMRFKVDSARGSYLSAIKHFQKYKALNDSIFSETKSKQITQLSIQYETEKKDKDLKLKQQAIQLLTEESRLQQNQLQQAADMRNVIIAGGILLMLLFGLAVNRYQLKQRSNHLIETKQTEINRKNQCLELIVKEKDLLLIDKEQLLIDKDHLLEEREWMLKEIHHRVKNNLQIITSLLDSQGAFLRDEVALAAIRESQNRVHAMALIHQKLYQTNRLSSIPMVSYIHEIVDYLMHSFNRVDTIRKHIQVAPIDLAITSAIPIALILNEALTNTLKYAFPNDRPGNIHVELFEIGNATYQLSISDDGVGFPAGINPTKSRTLGMSLIRGLSEQLDGILSIQGEHGVHISLRFVEDKNIRIRA